MFRNYNDFTNLYSLQKTLRFELRPVGKTLEHIKNSGIIESDETLEEQYAIVKNIIDRFHRMHIDEALSLVDLTKHLDTLKRIQQLYLKRGKTDKEKEELKKLSADLRNLIVSYLKGNVKEKIKSNLAPIKDRFEILFGKELFTNEEFILLAKNGEEKKAIQAFKGFTTYFKGFQENRKNMYSEEDNTTAISYRIINENLPLFIENIARFQKVMNIIEKTTLEKLKENLKTELKKHNLPDIFTIEYFNNVLTQEGISGYNVIIGGKTTQDGVKIQGLNEIINLYNQQSKDIKLPILKPLHKQILSEEYSNSFRIAAFENDNEVLKAIDTFWNEHVEKAIHSVTGKHYDLLLKIENLCDQLKKYKDKDLEKLFIERKNLSTVSHQVYGQWNIIRDALRMHLEMNNKNIKENDIDKYLDKDAFSWKEIKDSIKIYKEYAEDAKELDENGIVKYFSSMNINEEDNEKEYSISLIKNINEKYNNVKSILEEDRTGKSDLHQDKEKVAIIKEFLDSLKQLQWFLKLLYVSTPLDEKNYEFYNELEVYYEALLPLNSLYNKVRNYMTRKPYSVEKFKLNFYSPTLLDGWDKNKETANLSLILRKKGKYYLGIMNKENNTIFEDFPKPKSNDCYEKMIYKLLPGPNKMLPKVFFSKKGLDYYKPSKEILNIYDKGEFKKDKSGNLKKESLHKLINFYKDAISKNQDWKIFEFKFRNAKEYEDISQFYRDVEEQGYLIKFENVDAAYVDKLVEEGKLYLFQIYNKDFSENKKSNGNPNLHTIYWTSLFDIQNLKDVVYKLNGEAEVFYRKKSIDYPDEIYNNGHHKEELKGKFDYPIIKDRRYTQDKFLFHVPITLNFISKEEKRVNQLACEYLGNTKEDFHIIGIDRGERHLLYLSLIDKKGKIIKQLSLNTIRNENYDKEIDYRAKLNEKEKKRDEARKNWDVIENIKELKEGYMSQVIYIISKMMVDNKALLVMEDLNIGFKRGRFKVEKQVYQKFEKMLIDKLNYLVFKNNKPLEPGGSLKAYQLTSKFDSFKKLGKQSGFIFYVPSSYTSKIDPTTGFYNFIKVDVPNIEKGKEFFSKFEKIIYNKKDDYFEFHCKYGKFVSEPKDKNNDKKTKDSLTYYNAIKDTVWVLCSTHHERYKIVRNKAGYYESQPVDVNRNLKEIFTNANVNYNEGKDLKNIIIESNNAKLLKSVAEQLKLILAMRYNNGKHGTDEKDYILSPVKNKEGKFFCTLDGDSLLPVDADANGAYNIALKGLLLIEKIRRQQGKIKDLYISNLEWFMFMMSR